MARARNIKPGFFKNEDLAECSPFARLCFIGLWMLADREGRLEDRPKRIKGELFPYESFEVEPLLQELARYGFIERYEVDSVHLIAIPKFAEHQTPHIKEKASELPSKHCSDAGLLHDADGKNDVVAAFHECENPDKPEASPGQAPDKPEASPGQAPDKPEASPGQAQKRQVLAPPDILNPDILNPSLLNPDSLNLTTGTSPVVPRAQAHATPSTAPPVDNPKNPEGLAEQPIAEPEKTQPVSEAVPAKLDKPPKDGRKTERGSRLSDDWQLPKAWGDWALGERHDMNLDDVRREAKCFANFWHAKPGQNARKLNWEATWQNWILRANGKPNTLPHARASPRANGVLAASIPPDMEQAFAIAEQNLFGVVIDEPV